MEDDLELDFGEDELVYQQPSNGRAAAGSAVDEDREDAISFGRASAEPEQQAAVVQEERHTAHRDRQVQAQANGTADRSRSDSANSRREPANAADAEQQASRNSTAAVPSSKTADAASTRPAAKAHDESLDALGNKLPKGWVSRVSRSTDSGAIYYRNVKTNTSSWEIPTKPAEDVAASPAPAPAPAHAEQRQKRQDETTSSTQSRDADKREQEQPAPSKKHFVHPDRLKLAGPAIVESMSSSTRGELRRLFISASRLWPQHTIWRDASLS